MYTLSIDTSTTVCSVAVHQSGNLIHFTQHKADKSHSELLMFLINEVCRLSQISLQDLSAIIIGKGPGSYTGLRIASATAKGLCFALEIPLVAIDSLDSLAYNCRYFNGLICPMIDARRMEVFTALYEGISFKKIDSTRSEVIDSNFLNSYLVDQKILFIGDGSNKCQSVIDNPNAIFSDNVVPNAEQVGYLGYQKLLNQEFEDLAYFVPSYSKEFYTSAGKSIVKG